MKTFFFVAALCLTLISPDHTCAQTPQWANYTNGDNITALAYEGAILWVGTSGGLVAIDTLSGAAVFYNKSNSGLPSNNVLDVLVDPQGVKWINTGASGIVRFDGSDWTVYNSLSGLPYSYSYEMLLDAQGQLWVACGPNLATITDAGLTIYTAANGLLDQSITALAADTSGTLWLGVWGGGIVLFKNGAAVDTLTTDDGLPTDAIRKIAIDANGAVWIATDSDKLTRFDQNGWTYFSYADLGGYYFPFSNIHKIYFGAGGQVWLLSTYSASLAVFNGTYWMLEYLDLWSIAQSPPTCLLWDAAQNGWTGTSRGGLLKKNGGSYSKTNTSNSGLPGNYIFDIAPDADNRIWVAANGTGLTRFDDGDWTRFDAISDIYSWPLGVAIDAQGDKWITADFCTGQLSGQDWDIFCAPDFPGNPYLNDLDIHPDQSVWTITNDFLARYFAGDWTYYQPAEFGLDYWDPYLTIDTWGNVWVAKDDRVLRLNGSDWDVYTHLGFGIPANYYASNGTDYYGNFWMSTDLGLSKFTGSGWETYPAADYGTALNGSGALTGDPDGNIWIGVQEGLARFDGDTVTVYTPENSGLTSAHIIALASDAAGNIWIGTYDGGLAVFNENGITSALRPEKAIRSQPVATVFPNPASDHFSIQMDAGFSFSDHTVFSLYDQLGKPVVRREITSRENRLDRNGLPGGLYYWTICRSGKPVFSGKIMFSE